jgi:hypothetical protein
MAVEGNLNALGLILTILLTGCILVRYGTLTGSLRRAPLAIGIAFGVMMLASCLTTVFDDFEVDSSHQLLIPSACLLLLLVFTGPTRMRTMAVLAVVLATFVWSSQILLLVGPNTRYTSNPEAARRSCWTERRADSRAIRAALSEEAEHDKRSYPTGWFAECDLSQRIPADYLRYTKAPSAEIQPFWHSALTGLYGKTHRELFLWYPGGRLREGLQRMEFRPQSGRERKGIQGQEKKAAASASALPGRTGP